MNRSLIEALALNFYLQPLTKHNDVTVWLVDGYKIRCSLDIEFTNGAHELSKPYVPQGEIWLDREAHGAGDIQFWAERQAQERAFRLSGMSESEAFDAAVRVELDLRRANPHTGPLVTRDLGNRDGFKVLLVNGRYVRDTMYVDFTMGGNPAVYPWVPKGEMWLDDAMIPEDWEPTLAHEIFEYNLMTQQDLSYDAAHARASAMEKKLRTP